MAAEGEEVDALAIIKEQAEKRHEEINKALLESLEEYKAMIEEKEAELVELRSKRDVRRKEVAEERKRIEKIEEERKAKAKEDMIQRKEQAEKKKKERERSLRAMHDPNAYKAIIIEKEEPKKQVKTATQLAEEKAEAMKERVKALAISASMGQDKLKEVARNLLQRLQGIFAECFDMKVRRKRQEYDHKELIQRIKDLTKVKEPVAAESAGKVHKFMEGGIFSQADGSPKTRMENEKDAGSIMSSGGVAGRAGMFGGGASGKKAPELARSATIDLTK